MICFGNLNAKQILVTMHTYQQTVELWSLFLFGLNTQAVYTVIWMHSQLYSLSMSMIALVPLVFKKGDQM